MDYIEFLKVIIYIVCLPKRKYYGIALCLKMNPNRTLRAKIVPWGKETRKRFFQTDFPCMLVKFFRVLISITNKHSLDIGEIDITKAFIQAFGFQRLVFLKTPNE